MAETVVLQESYGLSCERIREIAKVQEVSTVYKDYFQRTAAFIVQVMETYERVQQGAFIAIVAASFSACGISSSAGYTALTSPMRHASSALIFLAE